MRELEIPVAHGRLEALLDRAESPPAAVVVCHPHPQMGGTMHQPIAYQRCDHFGSGRLPEVARVLSEAAGWLVDRCRR